ncbi:hypothetical protein [Flavobacterium sp. U410]
MRNVLAYAVMIVPLIIYNLYCFATKEPNSGIDFVQVLIAFVLGIIFYNVGLRIKNKGKVE